MLEFFKLRDIKVKKWMPLFLALLTTNTFAGSASTGKLSKLHFMSNGVIIVYTSGARTDVPTCAQNQPSRFALNGTTDGGKVQVSGLLSAYATGKNVIIKGASNCNAYGDTESINYFRTVD